MCRHSGHGVSCIHGARVAANIVCAAVLGCSHLLLIAATVSACAMLR